MTFNARCGISQTIIEGNEPIKVFFLIPIHRPIPVDGYMKRSQGIYNTHSPICLPINAMYNSLEETIMDIERDETVQCIEKWFDCSFESFFANVRETHTWHQADAEEVKLVTEFSEKYGAISVMYVHRSLYDGYVESAPNEYNGATIDAWGFTTGMMQTLGFVFDGHSDKAQSVERWTLGEKTIEKKGDYLTPSGIFEIKDDGSEMNISLERVIGQDFSYMSQYPYGHFLIKEKLRTLIEDGPFYLIGKGGFHVWSNLQQFDPLFSRFYDCVEHHDFLMNNWVQQLAFDFVFERTGGQYHPSFRITGYEYDKWQLRKLELMAQLLKSRTEHREKEMLEWEKLEEIRLVIGQSDSYTLDVVTLPKVIKTDSEYKLGLAEIDRLFLSEPNTLDADLLELWIMLVDMYEKEHYSIPHPNPVDEVLSFMQKKGWSIEDVEKAIQSQKESVDRVKKNPLLKMVEE